MFSVSLILSPTFVLILQSKLARKSNYTYLAIDLDSKESFL